MVPQVCLGVFNSPTIGLRLFLVLSLSLFLFLSGPMKGYTCDVVGFSYEHLPYPSPSPCHENSFHALILDTELVTLSLKMVFGQNSLLIRLKLFVLKTDTLVRSLTVILQHSEPYRRVDFIQFWYSLSFALMLCCWSWDVHRFLSILNALVALFRRLLMSLRVAPVVAQNCKNLRKIVLYWLLTKQEVKFQVFRRSKDGEGKVMY